MKCDECGALTSPGYMCDEAPDDKIRCAVCFEVLHCEAHHEEGCLTVVIEG